MCMSGFRTFALNKYLFEYCTDRKVYYAILCPKWANAHFSNFYKISTGYYKHIPITRKFMRANLENDHFEY